MSSSAPPVVPGYRILKALGAGGMGAVYEAEKLSTHEVFAVKLIRRHLAGDPLYLARFGREVEALRRIRHPNVVDVFEWSMGDEARGIPAYVVMELLEGESLEDRIRREKRLGAAEATQILLQVLEGLAAAHDVGVLHRDLGPSNIFLEQGRLGATRVRLLDFGLARPIQDDQGPALTQEGTVMGKPAYIAPESLAGRPGDVRTDLFACGIVLYQALAGRTPFDATTSQLLWVERWSERNQEQEYRPPSTWVPDLPDDLDAVVRRAIRRQPEQRFASAREMQAALLEAERRLPLPLPAPAAAPGDCVEVAAPGGDAASHTAAARSTAEVPAPAGRLRHLAPRLAAAAVGLALLVVLALWGWGGGRAGSSPPSTPSAAPPPAAPPGPSPAPVAEVRLSFVELPFGSEVRVGERRVTDPAVGVRLPRSDRPVEVAIRVSGDAFEPWAESVVPDRDLVIRPALRRRAVESAEAPDAGAPPDPDPVPPSVPPSPPPPAADAGASPDVAPDRSPAGPAPDAGARSRDVRDAAPPDAGAGVPDRPDRGGAVSPPRDAGTVEGRHGTTFQTTWEGAR